MENPCGLFGKLQAKRDFIAIRTPREFLSAWEPWIQSAMSASRLQLGQDWRQAFVTAPIWRFWLGAEICGRTTVGATMPSMDAVGRYFPLTLVAHLEGDGSLAPPELDAQETWFDAAEDLLLSTLEGDFRFDDLTLRLSALPRLSARVCARGVAKLARGAFVSPVPEAFPGAFSLLRETGAALADASSTFWWTIGGEAYARTALMSRRMPDPHLYSCMLTGRFGEQVHAKTE